MKYIIECEREADGRWLAEVAELPGVLAYGATAEQATARAEVLALRVLAEQLACPIETANSHGLTSEMP